MSVVIPYSHVITETDPQIILCSQFDIDLVGTWGFWG